MKAMGCFKPYTTKNINVQTQQGKPGRRNSRLSTATFNNAVDFEVTGNTNNVHHLISSMHHAGRHPSQLNFELNLRTYASSSKFTGQKPWEYPQSKGKGNYDPVGIDKGSFGHTQDLTSKLQMLMTKRRSKNDDYDDTKSRRQDLTKFIHSDPQNKKYSNKYRVTNANDLKILLTKNKTHATNVPTLAWQTSLRPNLGNNSAWDT